MCPAGRTSAAQYALRWACQQSSHGHQGRMQNQHAGDENINNGVHSTFLILPKVAEAKTGRLELDD